MLREKDTKAGTTSWTYQLSAEGAVEGSAIAVNGGLSGKTGGALKVTRDKDNQLVSLSFISTREGSAEGSVGVKGGAEKGEKSGEGTGMAGLGVGKATVTETTLELDNPADRATAQTWLSGSTEQVSSPFSLSVNSLIPSSVEDAGGGDFGKLLYEKARVSQSAYRNITNQREFGASLNLGFELGASYTQENGTSTAVGSTYLGAPDVNGRRPMVDFKQCY